MATPSIPECVLEELKAKVHEWDGENPLFTWSDAAGWFIGQWPQEFGYTLHQWWCGDEFTGEHPADRVKSAIVRGVLIPGISRELRNAVLGGFEEAAADEEAADDE